MTPDEKMYLQGVLNDVHEQFVDAVSLGRKMKREDVWKLADGSVYTGRQAKQMGLVDELGVLEDAIKIAGKLGNIQGEPKVGLRIEQVGAVVGRCRPTHSNRHNLVDRLIVESD